MCSLGTKPTATSALGGVDRDDHNRICKLATDDSTAKAAGFALVLKQVRAWAKKPKIKWVRKYRIGDDRYYVTGRHTDCHYTICHIMLNKRKEDDKPFDKQFQKMIEKSLEGDETPMLPRL